ncbi:MAG: RluA family pseudouridine synthase [candidate division Zixibacteria bacterium]
MSDAEEQPTALRVEVEDAIAKTRLDRYLADHAELDLSRSKVQALIEHGHVTVNGKTEPSRHKLRGGETIEIAIQHDAPASELMPEEIALDIAFEDDHLLIVNKPAGMVTHPAPGNRSGTLANALAFHFTKLAAGSSAERPGIVHRLDKNTSGLLVVAKTDKVYTQLQEAIQARKVKRSYTGLVCGHMPEESGSIDLPVGRSRMDTKLMAVNGRASREARTDYSLILRYRSFDLLQIQLQTGRTHQIRVHMTHIGHPIFGDPDYGGREKLLRGMFGPERPMAKQMFAVIDRQALHAAKLEFTHPVTGEEIACESPVPEDFQKVLDMLDREGSEELS